MICCWLVPAKWQPSWLPVGGPPVRVRFVQRLERPEGDSERVAVVLHHLRQVVGEGRVRIVLQVVRAVGVPRRAAALRHPVRRRIGERFEDRVRVALDDPLQDVALVRVGVPVPGPRRVLEAGHLAPLPHVLVRRVLAAADVVAEDVVAEPGLRIDDRVHDRVARGRAPSAHVVRPPAQAGPPPFERLAARRRIDLHQRGAGRRRDRPPRRVGARVDDAAGARAAAATAGRAAVSSAGTVARATAAAAHGAPCDTTDPRARRGTSATAASRARPTFGAAGRPARTRCTAASPTSAARAGTTTRCAASSIAAAATRARGEQHDRDERQRPHRNEG